MTHSRESPVPVISSSKSITLANDRRSPVQRWPGGNLPANQCCRSATNGEKAPNLVHSWGALASKKPLAAVIWRGRNRVARVPGDSSMNYDHSIFRRPARLGVVAGTALAFGILG